MDFDNDDVRLEGMAKNRRLDALATHANENAIQAEHASRGFIKYAFEAGRALCEAKRLVGNRYWTQWLAKEFHKSRETARAYMRVFRKWNDPTMQEARSRGGHIESLNAALKIIRKGTNGGPNGKTPLTEEQVYRAAVRESFCKAIRRLTKNELLVLADRFDIHFWPAWIAMFRQDDEVLRALAKLAAEAARTPKAPAPPIKHCSDNMPLFKKYPGRHWIDGRLSARAWAGGITAGAGVEDEEPQSDEWDNWDEEVATPESLQTV